MESAINSIKTRVRSPQWVGTIHPPERVALAFFIYLGLLAAFERLSPAHCSFLLIAPVVFTSLWLLEANRSSNVSIAVRQWSLLALILLGYWSLGWFRSPPLEKWQTRLAIWDRTLLNSLYLRSAIEAAGPLVPALLESVYLFLYAMPAVALAIVYRVGGRASADRFLLCLLLGTFSVYALLPLFPVLSPRVVFPEADLPRYSGVARNINTWLLDHLDISTSVFPSGHVAVAFSSAFGLLSALHERRRIWISGFVAAAAVYVATIYGRYHYAVDGLASIAISFVTWNISRFLGNDEG